MKDHGVEINEGRKLDQKDDEIICRLAAINLMSYRQILNLPNIGSKLSCIKLPDSPASISNIILDEFRKKKIEVL